MTQQYAFSCDDATVLAEYEKVWNEFYTGWSKRLTRSATKIGKNKGPLVRSFFSVSLVGLEPDDEKDPPQGWVYRKNWGCLRPRPGVPGAVARQWMEDHKPPQDPMSYLVDSGLSHFGRRPSGRDWSEIISSPLVFFHDGVLWALYTGKPEDKIKKPWKTRKLSEYYAAKEAADEEAVEAGEEVSMTPITRRDSETAQGQ